MGKGHQKSELDRARDELMSLGAACGVLDVRMIYREEWLDGAIDYLADRRPSLSDLQITQLEMIGRQYIQPAIPHGKDNHANNRPEATVLTTAGERVTDGDVTETVPHAEVAEPEHCGSSSGPIGGLAERHIEPGSAVDTDEYGT